MEVIPSVPQHTLADFVRSSSCWACPRFKDWSWPLLWSHRGLLLHHEENAADDGQEDEDADDDARDRAAAETRGRGAGWDAAEARRAASLLARMLAARPEQRGSAAEALAHPYLSA